MNVPFTFVPGSRRIFEPCVYTESQVCSITFLTHIPNTFPVKRLYWPEGDRVAVESTDDEAWLLRFRSQLHPLLALRYRASYLESLCLSFTIIVLVKCCKG